MSGESVATRIISDQKRGYSAIFWETVRHTWETATVSDVKFCVDIAIDRKSLRKKRNEDGWQRKALHINGKPATREQLAARYDFGVAWALSLKDGEDDFERFLAKRRADVSHQVDAKPVGEVLAQLEPKPVKAGQR